MTTQFIQFTFVKYNTGSLDQISKWVSLYIYNISIWTLLLISYWANMLGSNCMFLKWFRYSDVRPSQWRYIIENIMHFHLYYIYQRFWLVKSYNNPVYPFDILQRNQNRPTNIYDRNVLLTKLLYSQQNSLILSFCTTFCDSFIMNKLYNVRHRSMGFCLVLLRSFSL